MSENINFKRNQLMEESTLNVTCAPWNQILERLQALRTYYMSVKYMSLWHN